MKQRANRGENYENMQGWQHLVERLAARMAPEQQPLDPILPSSRK